MVKRPSVEFVIMRGGTSRGIFFREQDVPTDRARLSALLLDVLGSPDRRQIDGLGGADKLTSKACVIGPPVRSGTDVTYLFGQVGIANPDVDYGLVCGNLTAAVGVYAIEAGYVQPREGITRVRIHSVNNDKLLVADVPVRDGVPQIEGEFAISGVPGTGAPIGIDFAAAVGAKTGRLLPLGGPLTKLPVAGLGTVEVSVVDLANLLVFVAAESIGMSGTEGPDQIDGDAALLARIQAIRGEVARRVGLGEVWERSQVKSVPTLIALQSPRDYRSYATGELVPASSMDIVGRLYGSGSTHRAYAGGSTACTGVACRIPGTLPYRLLSERGHAAERIQIGHPSGTIPVDAEVAVLPDGHDVRRARIFRTARRIAEGRVFLKRSSIETAATRASESVMA
jgi:2-methylaconitate cis-trans-isomerase PrpF